MYSKINCQIIITIKCFMKLSYSEKVDILLLLIPAHILKKKKRQVFNIINIFKDV